MIRPTARLHFEIDPSELNDKLTDDVKRCFLNVAPLRIGARPAIKDSQPARNILGLEIVLRQPYWEDTAESNGMWRDHVLPWLKGKLYKLNATVQNYNATRAEQGQPIAFGQLEVVFGERVVVLELEQGAVIPKNALELIDQARTCAQRGLLPSAGFLRIEIPRGKTGGADVWNIRAQDGSLRPYDPAANTWA